MSTKVDIEKIRPNPYQPEGRLELPEEEAEKYGKSILQHGLIQTPIVRRCNGAGLYEMGDGWLRLQGFKWLVSHGYADYQEIPVEERDLSDQQMADLVMEANTIRKDLTSIEEATLFHRYITDFGISETELAKNHNLTQGAVANTIRLLQLPDTIKQKVQTGELGSTHARQLLRMNVLPEAQLAMAEECIKDGNTVNELDREINRYLWNNSKSLDKDQGGYYGSTKPVFDLKECQGCEWNVMVVPIYRDEKKQARCLNEAEWQKKQDAAETAIEAKRLKAAEKATEKSGGLKVYTKLDYDKYENLERGSNYLDNPAECKDCKKRGLYKSGYREGKPELVCLDKACFRRKKTKMAKATNKLAKEQDISLTEKLSEEVFPVAGQNPTAAMRLVTRKVMSLLDATEKRDIVKLFDVPTLANGRLDVAKMNAKLATMEIDELMHLAIASVITNERRSHGSQYYGSNMYSTRLGKELRRDIAVLTGKMSDFEREETVFQEAQCKSCSWANQEFVGTGKECCGYTSYGKSISDEGKCSRMTVIKKEKAPPKAKPLAEVMNE